MAQVDDGDRHLDTTVETVIWIFSKLYPIYFISKHIELHYSSVIKKTLYLSKWKMQSPVHFSAKNSFEVHTNT